MKKLLFNIAVLAFFFSSCKKDGGKGCWQAFQNGADVPGLLVCDVTKAEAENRYPAYWFYRQGEAKYCWRVQLGSNTYYTYGVPESMADKYKSTNGAYQFTKVDCSSFCNLRWLEKHQSKITGLYSPNQVYVETLLAVDTCSKLFVGRVIIYRETTDSLITREVLEKKP